MTLPLTSSAAPKPRPTSRSHVLTLLPSTTTQPTRPLRRSFSGRVTGFRTTRLSIRRGPRPAASAPPSSRSVGPGRRLSLRRLPPSRLGGNDSRGPRRLFPRTATATATRRLQLWRTTGISPRRRRFGRPCCPSISISRLWMRRGSWAVGRVRI